MANRFVLNETSYHGAGAIAEIATETRSRGFKKAFVCSDPDLVKFGVTLKEYLVICTTQRTSNTLPRQTWL